MYSGVHLVIVIITVIVYTTVNQAIYLLFKCCLKEKEKKRISSDLFLKTRIRLMNQNQQKKHS